MEGHHIKHTKAANYQRVPSPTSGLGGDTIATHHIDSPDGGPSSSLQQPFSSSYNNNSAEYSYPAQSQYQQQQQSYPNYGQYGVTEQQPPCGVPRSNNNNHAQQQEYQGNYHNNNVQDEDDDPTSSSFASEPQYLYITPPTKALVLQTLTTLSTIVFTVLPVVIKAGADATWGNWYSWRDACRLIEPFCSGLLHSWFFYNSDLMRRWPVTPMTTAAAASTKSATAHDDGSGTRKPRFDRNGIPLDERNRITAASSGAVADDYASSSPVTPQASRSFKNSPQFKAFLSTVFTFFLIVYVTGAGIHTAAAFFKNTIALFLDQHSQGIGLSTHPLTHGDGQLSLVLAQQLKEGYILIQDVWEHSVSHYTYAFGALGMSWCEMIAYSGQVLPQGVNLARVGHIKTKNGVAANGAQVQSSKRLVFLWIVASVLYGGIVAGVACQYPKGLYVGIVYVLLLLLVVCGYILSSPTRGLFSLGRHYILQTYVIGGVVAAVAIVIYMAINHFDMLTSNDKSHLGSINRP